MAAPAKPGGAGVAKIVGLNGSDVLYIARKYRIVLGRRSKSSAADVVLGTLPPFSSQALPSQAPDPLAPDPLAPWLAGHMSLTPWLAGHSLTAADWLHSARDPC